MLRPLLVPLADLADLADKVPEDEDVVAGPLGFIMFLFLIAAVVLLSFSLVKRLRNAQAAQDAGVYGGTTADRTTAEPPVGPTDPPGHGSGDGPGHGSGDGSGSGSGDGSGGGSGGD